MYSALVKKDCKNMIPFDEELWSKLKMHQMFISIRREFIEEQEKVITNVWNKMVKMVKERG